MSGFNNRFLVFIPYYATPATRILQFAINTVIYALTQEGSMTQRLMQIVH